MNLENLSEGETVPTPAETSPRPCWNQRDPTYRLQAERPEHRIIIMMCAAGYNNVEIVEMLLANGIQRSAPYVGNIRKQPWAVEQILKEVEKAGREPIQALFKNQADEMQAIVFDMARNAESEQVRLKAAQHALDRAIGPVTAKVEVTHKDPSTMTDDELLAIAGRARTN